MNALTETHLDIAALTAVAAAHDAPGRPGMVYLASPYSDPDPAVREQRFEWNCRAAAGLIRQGRIVYAPIVHGHPLTRYGLPGDWNFWKAADIGFLMAADELVVLRLPGWDESRGVGEEIALAEYAGKPVRYFDPVDATSPPTLAHVATEAAP